MKIKKWVIKKVIAVFSAFILLISSFAPYLLITPAFNQVNAQEVSETPTPTPIVEVEPTPIEVIIPEPTTEATEIPTPTAEPTIEPSATPEITPIPEVTVTPTPSPSPWTFEKVELNKEYQNGGVILTFTKLPDPSGNIKIEEITLTEDQIKQTGSLSDKAYDITSDMKDGEFTYNLSLPIPESSKGKSVEVKFAEELSNIGSAEKVENNLTKTDTSVSVTDLNHFTIFVVVTPATVNTDCSGAGVGIVGTDTCYNSIQVAIDAAVDGDIINLTANISGITETVVVNKAVTINGGGFTLSFTGLEADGGLPGVDDGLTIQDVATINNLTVDAGLTTPSAWDGTYAIQVYHTTATLNNVTAKNGNGGILNNNSTVTLTGAINVSDNGMGGIESSGANASLNVADVSWTNSSEVYGLPTIWEDGLTGDTVINYGAFTRITKGGQYQYYLTASNGTTINVPANYSTIQAAVNAANSGDTINIAAGDYTGNLTITKSLSLIGVGDDTHIIGGIDSNGANVTIQDLKITNQNDSTFYYGVKASANNDLTLENITIDVLYYGIRMGKNDPSTSAVITINNSRIRGYAAIHFNGSNDALAVVNTGTVINVFNTSLVGTTSYGNSGGDDFAVIALAYTSGAQVNFTGTSSIANEFTGGAGAKENLILFYFNADNNSVTGTPDYINAGNSTTNAVELFESAYGPYTNTVEGQVVARYVQNTTEFQAALADAATTPIVVGRGDSAITTTQDNTLNTGTTLLIDANNTPTTIASGTTLVNNGTIIIETGATLINNGIIRGTGTITGTVDNSGGGTIEADHTVTFDANSGSGSMSTQTTNVSTALTANAFTRIGYTFAGWNTVALGGGTSYANGASYAFSADVTLYAQWTIDTFTFTRPAKTGNGGGVYGGTTPGTINYGTSVSVTATVDSTSNFTNWIATGAATSCNGSSVSPCSFTMTGDASVQANYALNSYTITFNSAGGSAVSAITQDYGTSVTAPAAPTKEGYTFTGWTPTIAATMPAGGQSLTAGWADTTAPNTPIITTTSKSVNTSTIQITGTAEAGSTITITGGASTTTGTATGGNYSITVTLNQNVVNNLNVTAKDGSNNESSPATVAITHDNIKPTGTISINGGAAYTNIRNVTLTLSAGADLSGVTEMAFNNGSDYSDWEAYSTSKSLWTLSQNDGLKTVRVKFRDAAANETAIGIPATITVDTVKPVISLNGSTPTVVNVFGSYTELGATATDAVDGTSSAIPSGSVNTSIVNSYTITYNATDAAGNVATSITRTVNVVDTTIPVITRVGSDTVTLEIHNTYTDAGVTASDNYDGNLTSSVVTNAANINKNVVGSYTVTYNVVDAHSNPATQVTRTVNVVDSIDSAFNTISSSLAGDGIASNIGNVTTDNIQNFSGLYFEKSVTVGEITTKMGRLTFTAELDLSDSNTQEFLQNLGDYMEASQGSMKFDARTATQMKEAGAEIRMYDINALGYYNVASIIVKDDEGNILSEGDDDYPDLTGISYASTDGGTLIFTTEHFTQFELDQNQTTPDDSGDATLSGDTTEVVLTDPNQDVTVDIASGTVDPTIDVSAFVSDNEEGGVEGILPEITINSDVADVVIPDGTTVTGPAGWDGIIQAPISGTPSGGNAPAGFSVGGTVISVGSPDGTLTFDTAVTIVLPGVTGTVGYRPSGSNTWQEITNVCTGTYANPTGAVYPGECAINNGTDTKIVTYHFTSFGNLTANQSSSGGGGTTIAGAPVCNDTKPGSAPTLLSAIAGFNSVTLTWSKAVDPVSYYLMTFGTSAGSQTYGNPNVGGADTTSYTVSGLSGGATYYFKVRAGNGCAPGDFSNELFATPTGGFIEGVPAGFEAGVLGETTNSEESEELTGESTPTGTALGVETKNGVINSWWWPWILLSLLPLGWVVYHYKKTRS